MAYSALILAAGSGSRMNSSIPKALTQINNESSLKHIVRYLDKHISNFFIVVSKQNHDIIDREIKSWKKPVNYKLIIQHNPSGILDGVLCGIEHINNENIALCWCDQPCYSELLIKKLICTYEQNKIDFLIPITIKSDNYIHLVIKNNKLIKVLSAREGDSLPSNSLSDGGIFIFNKKKFNELIVSKKDKLPLGKITKEKRFLDLFIEDDSGLYKYQFKKIPPHFATSFNTQSEKKLIEELLGRK